MILSDITIRKYLETKKITIFPEFNPKDIRPTGIRLHLGHELLVPLEGQTVDLDHTEEIDFERIDITDGFILKPHHFVLASTYEKIQVPRNIVCHLEGRSTVARIGLTVHCTSGIIDGNFEESRTIVLEMANLGPFNIVLRPKMALAMLSFTQLSTPIAQNVQTQYQGQDGVIGPNLKGQKR
ncbi:MAG: dCTP deaminase [Chlamydiae bacterium]|nr:dCTP deaminase [Chlamydiota bacterium]